MNAPDQPVPGTQTTYLPDCKHGPMIVINHGEWVTKSFTHYGEYSKGETDLFAHLLTMGDTMLDCGANIGALAIPASRICREVIAVEPQPEVCDVLRANVAMNQANVEIYQCAVGASIGKAWFERVVTWRYPSIEGYSMSDAPGDSRYPVRLTTIDELLHGRTVRLIKLDVEGAEADALRGAKLTLAKHRPILYVENDKVDRSLDLVREIHRQGYSAYWHATPLFEPDNHKRNRNNIFGNIVSLDLLCLPKEQTRYDTAQLHECTEDAPTWGGTMYPADLYLPGILDQPKAENRAGGAIWP